MNYGRGETLYWPQTYIFWAACKQNISRIIKRLQKAWLKHYMTKKKPLQQPGIRLLKRLFCKPSFTFPFILNHSKCHSDAKTTAAVDFCGVDLSCVYSREKKQGPVTLCGASKLWHCAGCAHLSAFFYQIFKTYTYECHFCKWTLPLLDDTSKLMPRR